MKLRFNRFFRMSKTIIIPLVLILSMFPALVQADLEAELRALREQMEAVHLELAEQGAMIRALYDYVDAEIGLEAVQQETRDDDRLRIEPLTQINDANLTHIAIANPVLDQIAAVTADGAVRIYDFSGKVLETLFSPDNFITAIAYAPDGEWLLAGTRTGTLMLLFCGIPNSN